MNTENEIEQARAAAQLRGALRRMYPTDPGEWDSEVRMTASDGGNQWTARVVCTSAGVVLEVTRPELTDAVQLLLFLTDELLQPSACVVEPQPPYQPPPPMPVAVGSRQERVWLGSAAAARMAAREMPSKAVVLGTVDPASPDDAEAENTAWVDAHVTGLIMAAVVIGGLWL